MQAACDIAFEYAHHRETFGQKIGTYQVRERKRGSEEGGRGRGDARGEEEREESGEDAYNKDVGSEELGVAGRMQESKAGRSE